MQAQLVLVAAQADALFQLRTASWAQGSALPDRDAAASSSKTSKIVSRANQL